MNKLLLKSIIIALIFCVGISSAASIQWYDYDTGVKEAEKTGKPMMIFFTAEGDSYGKRMEANLFTDSQVGEQINKFVTIKVDIIENRDIARIYGAVVPPQTIFVNKEKQIINRIAGFVEKDYFISAITEAWTKKDVKGESVPTMDEDNLGEISIKDLQDFIKKKQTQPFKIYFVIKGTIRNIEKRPIIDDETGRLEIVRYSGGLGGINNGDEVVVEGYAERANMIIADKIYLSSTSPLKNIPSSQSDSPKTNGFELILALISIAVILFIRKRNYL